MMDFMLKISFGSRKDQKSNAKCANMGIMYVSLAFYHMMVPTNKFLIKSQESFYMKNKIIYIYCFIFTILTRRETRTAIPLLI